MSANEPNVQLMLHVIKLFYDRKWSLATSTNYSFRKTDATVCISRSGVDKGRFTADDFMEVDMNGKAMPGSEAKTPSAETLIHTTLYQDPSVSAVLHTHSVAATVLSRKGHEVTFTGYEMMKGISGIDTHETELKIPILPNSQDIADFSKKLALNIPAVPALLIAGHGLYAWGKSIEEAQRHIEVVEFLLECRLASR